MRTLVLKLTSVFVFSLGCGVVQAADLPIVFANESSLPFSMSPNNFNNSPSNFKNSINNFANSPNNFDNSESNFDNSAANFANSSNGERRILYKKDDGMLRFVGYYVLAKNGTTNLFSSSGKRMFYVSKDGFAVFGGKDGEFCGALTLIKGEMSLALTEHGIKILFLYQ